MLTVSTYVPDAESSRAPLARRLNLLRSELPWWMQGVGEKNFCDTGWDVFFFRGDPPPPKGGWATKKSGSYRENFFFPCCTYHT